MHNLTNKIALAYFAIILGLCSLFIYQYQVGIKIETNVMKLLPSHSSNKKIDSAFDQLSNRLNRQVFFLIQAPTLDSAIASADIFTQKLRNLPLFSSINAKIDTKTQALWGGFFYPYRFQLLTQEQRERLKNNTGQQRQQVLKNIYNPFSGITSSELSGDPFLLFRDFISDLAKDAGNFTLKQGYLSKSLEKEAYVFLYTTLSETPFSLVTESQIPALLEVEHEIEQSQQVLIQHTGTIFYADAGVQSAKSEISTIGVGSFIGILVLIIYTFRSPYPLLLSIISITCGLLAATTLSLLIFNSIHLFSLVFGASLIGISIDYSFHYLTQRLTSRDNWDSINALRKIFVAITLGLITSLAGYSGLLLTPFPGLQQLALFSIIGLIFAYLSVVCLYPVLMSQSPSKQQKLELKSLHLYLSQWKDSTTEKYLNYVIPTALLILSLFLLNVAHYDDDIRQLQTKPSSLVIQENKIQEISGFSNGQSSIIVSAPSQERLLQELEQTHQNLDPLIKNGQLSSYQDIAKYVPSQKRQKENYALVTKLYHHEAPQLASQLGSEIAELNTAYQPLLPQDFLSSAVAKNLSFLWLGKEDNEYSALILLKGIKDKEEIKSLCQQSSQLNYLNKADELSEIFAQYRVFIGYILGGAFLLILLLLRVRYSFRQALAIILPCLIACISALALSSGLGLALNLFNILALMLILGIGIDYSLFFAEHAYSNTTLLAISLSAMTTILSFGLLALSATQAIHGFGITVSLGIFIAWFLAPMAAKHSNKRSQ